jgi:hypothetical protein
MTGSFFTLFFFVLCSTLPQLSALFRSSSFLLLDAGLSAKRCAKFGNLQSFDTFRNVDKLMGISFNSGKLEWNKVRPFVA